MSQAELHAAEATASWQAAALEKALLRYRSVGQHPEFADGEIITTPGSCLWSCIEACLSRVRLITSRWLRYLCATYGAGRSYAVVAAICCALVVNVTTGSPRSLPSARTGAAGCGALSSAGHQTAAPDYRKIRTLFAQSQWPDLRLAGTAYVDLAARLTVTPGTDGYEAVWFSQRLSAACARHGRGL
jgi:hypothetical protein